MTTPGWLVGFGLLAAGGVLQVVLLTYADLVLLSTTMIPAIMFNTFLAIKILGEKFLWKYDLPAFLLMACSAITIIVLADMEEKLFTPRQVKDLLGSLRSVLFQIAGSTLALSSLLYVRTFLRSIQTFEEDLHSWAKQQIRLDYIERP